MHLFGVVCVLIVAIQTVIVQGFFQWAFGTGNEPALKSDEHTSAEVLFELTPTDEKFLSEVKRLEETNAVGESVLGDCHRRLVLSLRQSCAKLSPEEIGKVSVNLLNCQNAIERRQQFPCTASMSLADCTRDMDAPSWTVYQLMSNRALAVCHSVGQQLFRARTEMLVNRLALASEQQVGQLREMHSWHERLRELQALADARMTSLTAQHDAIVTGQETLLQRQRQLEQALELNEQYLRQEKIQLEGGTQNLLNLTGQVKARLDATVNEVRRQEAMLERQRSEVSNTIKQYEESLHALLSRLETRGENMLALQEETFARVRASVEGIRRVNNSIGAIGTQLVSFQENVSSYFGWLQGNAVEWPELFRCCASHVVLLLTLMGLAGFLKFPICSRLAIITALPGNAYLNLTSEWHASPIELLVTLSVICAVDMLVGQLRSRGPQTVTVSNDELQRLINSIKRVEQQIEELSVHDSTFIDPDLVAHRRSWIMDSELSPLATSREWLEPNAQKSTSKLRCQGFNRDGSRCKRTTSSTYCGFHRSARSDVIGSQ